MGAMRLRRHTAAGGWLRLGFGLGLALGEGGDHLHGAVQHRADDVGLELGHFGLGHAKGDEALALVGLAAKLLRVGLHGAAQMLGTMIMIGHGYFSCPCRNGGALFGGGGTIADFAVHINWKVAKGGNRSGNGGGVLNPR